MILLTDTELEAYQSPCVKGECPFGHSLAASLSDSDPICDLCDSRATAKAQLKKVLKEAKTEDLSWKFRRGLMKEVR